MYVSSVHGCDTSPAKSDGNESAVAAVRSSTPHHTHKCMHTNTTTLSVSSVTDTGPPSAVTIRSALIAATESPFLFPVHQYGKAESSSTEVCEVRDAVGCAGQS